MCMSSLASEFPEDCKFYPADTKDDLHKVIVLIIYLELLLPALSLKHIYIYIYIFFLISQIMQN